METKEILTNSSLKTFRECPKKYYFSYEHSYEPAVKPEYFRFGSLWHIGIEAWEVNRDLDQALEAMNKERDHLFNDEYTIFKAFALMETYHTLYKDQPYSAFAIERPFRAPVINPETGRESRTFEYDGVFDGLYKDQSGRTILKESKTTSEDISPESDYWRRLQMDSQISGYYLGAEASGYKIESCIYDVVKKPMLSPYKATPLENRKFTKEGKLYANQREQDETPREFYERLKADVLSRPNYYFARKEIPRSANDLAEHLHDVWHTGQTIQSFRKSEQWPRNTASCITLTHTCQFWPVCSGQARIDDPNLYVKKESAHPELTKNIETREKKVAA